jgi:transcriptional regulator with XRE-family HTH domain
MASSIAERVAAEVRAEMARQRRTQAELAAAVGLSPQSIGRRLSGEHPFDVEELERAAAWLDVSVSSLLPGREVA